MRICLLIHKFRILSVTVVYEVRVLRNNEPCISFRQRNLVYTSMLGHKQQRKWHTKTQLCYHRREGTDEGNFNIIESQPNRKKTKTSDTWDKDFDTRTFIRDLRLLDSCWPRKYVWHNPLYFSTLFPRRKRCCFLLGLSLTTALLRGCEMTMQRRLSMIRVWREDEKYAEISPFL